MKKLLVMLMVVAAMVFVVSAAMAEVKAPVLVDGKLELKWDTAGLYNNGTPAGWLKFEISKDFGEGITAGYNFKVDDTNTVALDGDGYINMDFKTMVVRAQTSGMGGNVGKDITPGIDGAPGFKVELKQIEGVTGTIVVNGSAPAYNYLASVKYDKDGIYAGAGYQVNGDNAYVDPKVVGAKTGFGVHAGYNKADVPYSAGAEFFKGQYGMLYQAKGAYKLGSLLEVNAGALGKAADNGGIYVFDIDPDKYSALITAKKFAGDGITAFGDVKVNITSGIWVKGTAEYTTAKLAVTTYTADDPTDATADDLAEDYSTVSNEFTGSLSFKGEAGATFGNLGLSSYVKAFPGAFVTVDNTSTAAPKDTITQDVVMEIEGKAEYKLIPDKLKGYGEFIYVTGATVKGGLIYTPVGGIESQLEVGYDVANSNPFVSARLTATL